MAATRTVNVAVVAVVATRPVTVAVVAVAVVAMATFASALHRGAGSPQLTADCAVNLTILTSEIAHRSRTASGSPRVTECTNRSAVTTATTTDTTQPTAPER